MNHRGLLHLSPFGTNMRFPYIVKAIREVQKSTYDFELCHSARTFLFEVLGTFAKTITLYAPLESSLTSKADVHVLFDQKLKKKIN
jgi:hypothetical protein